MLFQQFRADVRYALSWLVRSPGSPSWRSPRWRSASASTRPSFHRRRPAAAAAADRAARPVVDIYTKGADGDTYSTTSYPDYLDLKAQNKVLTDMAGYSPAIAAVKMSDQSRMALGEVVTGNYFQVLGVKAAIGRTLVPDDDRPARRARLRCPTGSGCATTPAIPRCSAGRCRSAGSPTRSSASSKDSSTGWCRCCSPRCGCHSRGWKKSNRPASRTSCPRPPARPGSIAAASAGSSSRAGLKDGETRPAPKPTCR